MSQISRMIRIMSVVILLAVITVIAEEKYEVAFRAALFSVQQFRL